MGSGTYWIYEKTICFLWIMYRFIDFLYMSLIRMILNLILYLDNHLFVSIFVEKLDNRLWYRQKRTLRHRD